MKKLLSLFLVLCMLFTLFSGLTVSADTETAATTESTVTEGTVEETVDGTNDEAVTEDGTAEEGSTEEGSTEEETIVEGDGFIYDKKTCLLTVTGSGKMDDFFWWNDSYAPWSGYAKEAKKVIISDGITSIGASAFEDFIAIKEIEIPNSVKSIGINSFSGSGLSEINIPASVEVIDEMPFVNCDYMTSYNVAEESPYFCSENGVLFSKDKSVLIAYPLAKMEEDLTYTIPETVTEVKGYAFSRADNLVCVNFGSNVESIGDECFFNCASLTTVNFNEGLDFIGGGAFQHCKNITEISLPSTITKIRPLAFYDTGYYNNFENWENNLLYIDEYLITGEYYITDEEWTVEEEHFAEGAVTVKEGTVLIASEAFSWFNWDPAITSVSFPASLKYINEYAFDSCEGLTEIKLGSNVEWIDDGAFSSCTNLADIILGDNIKRIGMYAFDETAYVANTNHYIDGLLYNNKYVLGYTGSLPSAVEIRDGTTLIADNALSGGGTYSYNSFSVKFPESLKYIGTEAFVNTKTNTIEIPETVLTIGEHAIGFKKTYNYSLEEYVYTLLSDNLIQGHADTAAQEYALKYGIEFEDLDAPETVTFGCYTCIVEENGLTVTEFDGSYLYNTEVEIPTAHYGTTITKIASGAFYDCSNLTSITIPETVTTIEDNAFLNCTDVTFYVTCSSAAHTYAQNNSLNFVAECIFSESYDGIVNTCSNCGKTECEILGHNISGDACLRDGCTYTENGNLGGGVGETVTPDIGEIEDTTPKTEGRFTYTVSGGTATITDYDSVDAPSYLIIPSLLGGYSVTAIGDNAFAGCSNLTEVTVADSIVSIGNQAFCDCTNLVSITIPASVTSIEVSSFQMCLDLVIYAPAYSYAQQYATDNRIDFKVKCDAHIWLNATCTEPQRCAYCEQTVGTELGHTGGLATCETRAICLRCNLPYGEVLGHNMAAPTCTEPARCMEEDCEYTSAPALGHTGGTATCEEKAICTRCGEEYGETAEHSYIAAVTKATLTKNGKIVKRCACGDIKSTTTVYYPKTIKLSATSYTYNGAVKTPTVTVKDSSGKTVSSSNYTVTYASGRKNAGTYKVTVKMKGNYSGTKTLTFKINPRTTANCTYKLSTTSYTYNGAVKTPTVTVKTTAGTKLTKGTHYTVTYASGRKNVGTYKVTVKMKGNYTGTKTLTFKINPPKTTVSSLTAGKKSLKVYITKKSTQVTGYQIQYSTSKSFKSYKTKNISSYKTTSTTLSGLTAKKTYYVRVRT